MKPYVAILCPMRVDLPAAIVTKQFELLGNMVAYNSSVDIHTHVCVDTWPELPPGGKHRDRAISIAEVRQAYIARIHGWATPPSHVLWMDADIIGYKPDLCERLLLASTAFHSVVAPCVFLDGAERGKCQTHRWYDTAGFVYNNHTAQTLFPWFPISGPWWENTLVELNGSVGCVYIVPWTVFNTGGKYTAPDDLRFTEHYPVCQHAIRMGYKLLVDLQQTVFHAYLPDFGIKFH